VISYLLVSQKSLKLYSDVTAIDLQYHYFEATYRHNTITKLIIQSYQLSVSIKSTNYLKNTVKVLAG